MSPEGIHLDRKGLKLLRELGDIDIHIRHAESLGKDGEKLWAQLIARRILLRRDAKSHCAQAGLDWNGFGAALKRAEKG